MSYTAEIISVGTDRLLGNIANTDARDVSEVLSQLGINVYFHTVVGDNPERVRQAVEVARSRADIIITTGGPGRHIPRPDKADHCRGLRPGAVL